MPGDPMPELDRLRERGFGRSVGYGERPAVLVVDFIGGFTDPASPLGADVAGEIAATNRVIDAARSAGAPVLFTTIAYADPSRDAGVWARKIGGLAGLQLGSAAVAVDPRLHSGPADVLLRKAFASCFFGTDLHAHLQAMQVDTLLVCGCSTSGCVRATVVDACQLGYHAVVVQEAVADRSPAAHRQSLLDIEMKYGDVRTAEAVRDYLSRYTTPGRSSSITR